MVGNDDRLGTFASYQQYLDVRARLEADLAQFIGEAEAGTLDACRTVSVGAKACGGPASYAVYSSETSAPQAVESMAQAIRDLDDQANRQFELASDCAFVSPPTVVLEGGQCRAESSP